MLYSLYGELDADLPQQVRSAAWTFPSQLWKTAPARTTMGDQLAATPRSPTLGVDSPAQVATFDRSDAAFTGSAGATTDVRAS